MSGTREALGQLLAGHEYATSDRIFVHCCVSCVVQWRDYAGYAAHLAEVIAAACVVIPRDEIAGTMYGVRYTTGNGADVSMKRDRVQAIRNAAQLAAQYPALVIEPVQRPIVPWSVITREDGEADERR